MRTQQTSTMGAGPWLASAASPQRIRWGAVFGGAILGIALLALLTTLWFALAYGSGIDQIRTDLEWYVGISAIASLFVAGLLAGWLSGVRGAGSGFFNGVTIWAMMLILTLVAGVPAVLNVLNLGRVTTLDLGTAGLLSSNGETVLWATFFTILGGFFASGIGGAIGGAVTRPANAHLVDEPPLRSDVDRLEPAETRTVVVHESEDEDTTERRESIDSRVH